MSLNLKKFFLMLCLSLCVFYIAINNITCDDSDCWCEIGFCESEEGNGMCLLTGEIVWQSGDPNYLALSCLLISFGLFINSFIILVRDNFGKNEECVSILNLNSDE